MKAMKLLIPILQDYYPERLNCYYVMGANWFFRAMFTVVKTFLSEKTVNKVKVLAEDQQLLNYFDKHKLIAEFGGTSQIFGFGEESKENSSGKLGGSKGDTIVNDEEGPDEEEQRKMAQQMMNDFGVHDKKITLLKENSYKWIIIDNIQKIKGIF